MGFTIFLVKIISALRLGISKLYSIKKYHSRTITETKRLNFRINCRENRWCDT